MEILENIGDFNFLPKPYSIINDERLIPLCKELPMTNGVFPLEPHPNIAPVLSSGTKITLAESITPNPADNGVSIKSQIWKGLVSVSETDEMHVVVLKVFFSCFHTPCWSNTWCEIYDFFPAEEQAHREAWAYSRLKDVQGALIPKSQGFYNVNIQYFLCS